MSAKAAAAAQVIKATEDAEALAHDIMSQRQQMVDCDAKRHKNMEALAQFRKNAIGEKAWTCCGETRRPASRLFIDVCAGPFFLQLPSAQVKSMIEKGSFLSDVIADTSFHSARRPDRDRSRDRRSALEH